MGTRTRLSTQISNPCLFMYSKLAQYGITDRLLSSLAGPILAWEEINLVVHVAFKTQIDDRLVKTSLAKQITWTKN